MLSWSLSAHLLIISGRNIKSQSQGTRGVKINNCEGGAALKLFIWKSVPVGLTLLQQTWCNGLHCPHSLSAGRADEGFGKEEAEVSRISQLERKRVWDPVSVGPVYRAAWADICEKSSSLSQVKVTEFICSSTVLEYNFESLNLSIRLCFNTGRGPSTKALQMHFFFLQTVLYFYFRKFECKNF